MFTEENHFLKNGFKYVKLIQPFPILTHLYFYLMVMFQDLLCLSVLELMKVTGQSYWKVKKLLNTVSRSCAPKMQTVSIRARKKIQLPAPYALHVSST